jgi:hypothetical protein
MTWQYAKKDIWKYIHVNKIFICSINNIINIYFSQQISGAELLFTCFNVSVWLSWGRYMAFPKINQLSTKTCQNTDYVMSFLRWRGFDMWHGYNVLAFLLITVLFSSSRQFSNHLNLNISGDSYPRKSLCSLN